MMLWLMYDMYDVITVLICRDVYDVVIDVWYV